MEENINNVTEINNNEFDNQKTEIVEQNVKSCKSQIYPKISVVSMIVSIISVICLIIFFIIGNEKSTNKGEILTNKNVENTPTMAYVNTDSLLLNYKYSIKLQEDLMTEQKKSEANLKGKYQQFEVKYNSFMEKARLGSFLSQASMDSQQQELAAEQQKLQQLEESLQQKLMEKQATLNVELLDTVVNFLKEYNADNRYSVILNKAVILYGNEGMDITQEIIDKLNLRYEKYKKQEGK
ncbi:MAG: OmpH family outer membrane protein [Bacteroidales bacterium]|jgi:outer membrane protein|nr:OmpH family outer membrane protein [Bacteroidales bacterium]